VAVLLPRANPFVQVIGGRGISWRPGVPSTARLTWLVKVTSEEKLWDEMLILQHVDAMSRDTRILGLCAADKCAMRGRVG
jgi:hypothetical protein